MENPTRRAHYGVGMARVPLRDALTISYAAVVWSAVSGVASVVVGIAAASTALLGTGTDVLADMSSSVVLIWRFRAELHGRHASDAAERRAEQVASLALVLVAIGVAATAVARLSEHEGASSGAAGIVLAAASLVVLPGFAVLKYRIASAVPSPALRMDANITLVGATMAAVTLVGLATTSGFGWTSADPVAALVVAVIAGTVGVRNLRRLRPS